MLDNERRDSNDERVSFMEDSEIKEISNSNSFIYLFFPKDEYSSLDGSEAASVFRKNLFRFLIILAATFTAIIIISILILISVLYDRISFLKNFFFNFFVSCHSCSKKKNNFDIF